MVKLWFSPLIASLYIPNLQPGRFLFSVACCDICLKPSFSPAPCPHSLSQQVTSLRHRKDGNPRTSHHQAQTSLTTTFLTSLPLIPQSRPLSRVQLISCLYFREYPRSLAISSLLLLIAVSGCEFCRIRREACRQLTGGRSRIVWDKGNGRAGPREKLNCEL